MNSIVATKLSYRYCRKAVKPLDSIKIIVKECCSALNINEPQIIFCESLKKEFEAFSLRGEPFFIYDGCLIELLYLYDCILFSNLDKSDIDKLFYKLYGEELILSDDVLHSMYFTGKYSSMEFSFENYSFNNASILEYLSIQNYFLIGHELTHLSFIKAFKRTIPPEYRKFVVALLAGIAEKDVTPEKTIKDVLKDRAEYFSDTTPESIEEYITVLNESQKFDHFLEECYCDYMGFKLLIEHYENASKSVDAILSALNCLLTLECIRNDLRDGISCIKKAHRIANRALYFSLIRTELLLCTIEISNLNTSSALEGIHNRIVITDTLKEFISCLPDEKLNELSDDNLPSIPMKQIIDSMIKQLYYSSVSPELYKFS